MSLVARGLEARGLPTLSLSTLYEVTAAYKPPRACFLDFPIGCPAGRPHEAEQQRAILREVLRLAPTFETQPAWAIQELPFQWSPDGSRAWEDDLRAIYRAGASTVQSHQRPGSGPSALRGNERAFQIRCNC